MRTSKRGMWKLWVVGVAGGVLGLCLHAYAATVTTPIRFVTKGAACVSVKQASVAAHSDDSVVWNVTAEPGCKYEGKTVEILFTSGGNPGKCQCSVPLTKNAGKLTLRVKKHAAHQSYTYDIRVGGKPVADPRLEVDP